MNLTLSRVLPILAACCLFLMACDSSHSLPPSESEPYSTVVRSPKIPDRWLKFNGADLALWLPPNYQGGNPASREFALLEAELKAQGQLATVAAFERSKTEGNVLVVASDEGTLVSARKFPPNPGADPKSYVDTLLGNLREGVSLAERKEVLIGGTTAQEIVLLSKPARTTTQLYIFQNNDSVWLVSYYTFTDPQGAGIGGYKLLHKDFETSVKTVTLAP